MADNARDPLPSPEMPAGHQIVIREATIRDFEVISDLVEEVDRLHRTHLPDLFRKPRSAPREETFIVGLIRSPDAGVFLAESGAQVVGLVIIVTRTSPDFAILVPLRYAVIDTLVVAEWARERGVGHALMAHAESWAREHGLTRIELNVFEFNDGARRFYRGMGYTTLSRQLVKHLNTDLQ